MAFTTFASIPAAAMSCSTLIPASSRCCARGFIVMRSLARRCKRESFVHATMTNPGKKFVRKSHQFRVVTYNVHKCRGWDSRVRPGRIVDVLKEIDADIVALQEVLTIDGGNDQRDQLRFIARELN